MKNRLFESVGESKRHSMRAIYVVAITGLFLLSGGVTVQGQQEVVPPRGSEPAPLGTASEKRLPLSLTLKTDKKIYSPSEPIKMTLTAKNGGKEPVRLMYGTGQRFDMVLQEGNKTDGKIVWQWSKERMFTMMVGSETLLPGKSVIYTATLDPKSADNSRVLAKGHYTLRGNLATIGPAPKPTATAAVDIR